MSDKEREEEGNLLSPAILGLGRLEEKNLCPACRLNDFTALFNNPEAYIPDQSGYQCTARTVAHIMQHRESCIFCILTYFCLVSLRLKDVPNSDTYTVKAFSWTAGITVNDTFVDSDDERNSQLKKVTISRDSLCDQRYVRVVFRVCEVANEEDLFYFKKRDFGGGRTLIELHQRSCYKQDSRFSLQPWFKSIEEIPQICLSGRPFANQIRFDLVRHWVNHLKFANSLNTTPMTIKLIDIKEGKLIEADTRFRYVTLSYVWGGYKQVELTSETRGMFFSSGSITENSSHLSWTIKDAITVCRALDERYLWVDCLCIQQDDLTQKMAQIERMDVIYAHAIFTIINAGHQHDLNSDSPLSGVRPNTRTVHQFVAQADSFYVLGNTCPRLQKDLGLSKWRSRAWTFQEELLSRALLIFTSSQCFLQAGKRLFCEDMIFDADQPGTASIPLTYNTTQSYHCRAGAEATGEFDLEDYCFIIETYVKRNISFDQDAIKAVLGMLRRFSVKLDGRDSGLIFGHPRAAFDYSLCWTSDCFYPNTRRNCFPSWSWASRKHHIGFDLGHRHDKQKHLTLRGPLATSLYTDALSDGQFTLNKLLVEQIGIDILPVRKSEIDTDLYYEAQNLSKAELGERELHFSTTCIKLRISRYCLAIGEILSAERTEHASGWGRFIAYLDIQDTTDASITTSKEIGEICLEAAWRDSQPEELYLDFIVIRASPGSEPFCSLDKVKSEKTTHPVPDSEDQSRSIYRPSVEDIEDGTTTTELSQQQAASDSKLPKFFPALEDPRLNEDTQDCMVYASNAVDRRVYAAEDWRLSLMCVEWIDVASGTMEQGKEEQEEATRRVASRLDVMRYGPSVREWLDLGPTRINVVLA